MKSKVFGNARKKSLREKIELGEFTVIDSMDNGLSIDLKVEVEGEDNVVINIEEESGRITTKNGITGDTVIKYVTKSSEFSEVVNEYMSKVIGKEVNISTLKDKLGTLVGNVYSEKMLAGVTITSENSSLVFGKEVNLNNEEEFNLFKELMTVALGRDEKSFLDYKKAKSFIEDGDFIVKQDKDQITFLIGDLPVTCFHKQSGDLDVLVEGWTYTLSYLGNVFLSNITKLVSENKSKYNFIR